MSEQKLLEELAEVDGGLPQTYFDLIHQIDRFIFGAQRGFDIVTELLSLYMNDECEASTRFKIALSIKYKDAVEQKVAASARKEYATMNSCDEDVAFTRAEGKVKLWRLRLGQWMERLNSYKKIKDANGNMRGTG